MQRRTAGRGLGAVLFTDIVGSTPIAAEMGNTRWGELVSRHHRIVRHQIGRFGGREVDTAGDGFFVTFERPADAIRCAVATTEAIRDLGIEVRAGVSFGELETVGRKPGGLVVNTAARVMSVAGPGEVLVPASVKDIVPGAGISFDEHGVHQLKGLDGEFLLFKVAGVDGKELPPPPPAEEAAERRREIFPSGARRAPLIVGLVVGAVAVIVGATFVVGGLLSDEPAQRTSTGPLRHAVASIDPDTGQIRSSVPLGGPGNPIGFNLVDRFIAAGEGGVWLLRPPLLLHVDPLHREVRSSSTDVGVVASYVVTGFDAVWVQTAAELYRVNAATDEADRALVLPPTGGITTYSLALGDAVWVGVSDGTLVRLDPRTGARDQADTGLTIDRIAATRDGVWVVDVIAGGVIHVDPGSLRPTGKPIDVRGSIDEIAARGDDVWVLDKSVGIVTRIDAVSRTVRDSVRVGDDPTDLAVGLDAVWVGDGDGSLYRVDASTLEVTEFPVGADVIGVAVDEAAGSVWVYLGESVRPAQG